jgi:hypothetical protein
VSTCIHAQSREQRQSVGHTLAAGKKLEIDRPVMDGRIT